MPTKIILLLKMNLKAISFNPKHKYVYLGLFVILIAFLISSYLVLNKKKQAKEGVVLGAGDFTNQIIGTTNTQAVLTYSSPTTSPCTILVSESASYSPLINDVNPTLFTGSNKDDRQGSSSSGLEKVFVIGKRSADLALDGNRYSRALQAYTTHYYKIVCGSQEGTGSFTTKNIPTGNTYSDTIPGDTNGSSTWPTLLDDRNQIIIDPQTGLKITRISLLSDKETSPGIYPDINFGASAGTDACNPTLVPNSNGDMGLHCMVGYTLFWINPTTGEGWPIGAPASTASGPDGDLIQAFQFCSHLSTEDPNDIYCAVYSTDSKVVLVKLTYNGQNTFFNSHLSACTGSNEPCLSREILTPVSGNNDIKTLIHNFNSEFPTNFTENAVEVKGMQNGKILLQILKGIQDSYGWLAIFDPGNGVPVGQSSSTAGVIAAMSTYKHYPIRWCSIHGTGSLGAVDDWMAIGSNYLRGDSSEVGYGMYTSTIVAGNLPAATSTCPSNPFNETSCTDIVVDGEPCDESENPQIFNAKCGNASHSYLQDAEVGDIFGINPTTRGRNYSEFIRIIEKNGNNWKVSRGLNQTPIVSHNTATIDAACTAHDTVQANYDLTNWFWNFKNDPRGTGTPGTTIVFDKNGTGGHGGYRPNKMIEIYGSSQYQIRNGAVPNFIDAEKIYIDDGNPAFAGVQGIGYPNTVDSHATPFYNDEFFLDGRPMNSGGIEYSSAATSLGGGIYKYPAGAIQFQRKKLATIAYSGVFIMKDISGPNSNINTASDHSYCIVINPGECNTDSLTNEVYVKSTTATVTTCPYPGIAQSGWSQQHICIGDNSAYNQTISQVGPTVRTNGKNGRMLTHGLTTYNRQDIFWNVRATPDGTGMLFTLPTDPIYGEGSGQLFYAKLPPFAVDSVIRDDFMNIPVTIPQYTGATSASIKFGYAENGNPENFYCTSRNEACIKASESGKNYSFYSEGFSPVSCTSGCTINIPAIPSRVVYLKVQYHDENGDIISTLNTQVVAAEPEFNISSVSGPSFSISNISTSNIGNTTATITWTTSTSTDSQILYGLTNSYASSTTVSDISPKVTNHSVNLTGLTKNTTYLFVVKSVDALGNSITSSEQSFTTANNAPLSDTSPPTVSITSPTNSSTVSGTITITANASDNAGEVAVQFKLNSTSNIGAEDITSPYSATWDSTLVSNSTYTILATARDTSGNITTSSAITITVSNSSGGSGSSSSGGSLGNNLIGGFGSVNLYGNLNLLDILNQFKTNSATTTPTPEPTTTLPILSNRNRCLIKNGNNYRIFLEDQAYNITSPEILKAYGFEFKDSIEATELDKQTGSKGNILPPDGTLIKTKSSNTIYLVENGKKRSFGSLLIFTKLGFKISSVITVSQDELNKFPLGAIINSTEIRHPRGINVKDGKTIYWMGKEKRYAYPSLEVYNAWNIDNNFAQIVVANSYDKLVPAANTLSAPESCK